MAFVQVTLLVCAICCVVLGSPFGLPSLPVDGVLSLPGGGVPSLPGGGVPSLPGGGVPSLPGGGVPTVPVGTVPCAPGTGGTPVAVPTTGGSCGTCNPQKDDNKLLDLGLDIKDLVKLLKGIL